MKHTHMFLCAAIFAVALILVAGGSNAAFLLFPIACMAMMFGMMWFMMRSGGDDGNRS